MTPQERHYARLGRPDRLHLPPPEPISTSIRGLIVTVICVAILGYAAAEITTYIVTPPQLIEVPQ